MTQADAPLGFMLAASDPLSQMITRSRRAPSLASVADEMKVGSLTISAAGSALSGARSILREMRAHLLAAAIPGTDRALVQRNLLSLRDRLRAVAASALMANINLVIIPNEARLAEPDLVRIVSALTRGTTGDIMISAIDIDRNVTALFDDRQGHIPYGILDRLDGSTGHSLVSLDIATLSDAKRDQTALDRFILQIDAAIINIGAAASHLSIAQSRINLQSSFIMSLTEAVESELPPPLVDSDLDHLTAKQRAIETRRLLGEQPMSIANLNSQTVLKLFRGT